MGLVRLFGLMRGLRNQVPKEAMKGGGCGERHPQSCGDTDFSWPLTITYEDTCREVNNAIYDRPLSEYVDLIRHTEQRIGYFESRAAD
mgnify:CR=1 FL=1